MTPAVEVRDLIVRFGNFTAVDRVGFSVPPGEIFGFLGANGAGKTTTIRVLTGLLAPTDGDARVAGFSVRTQREELKTRVGYMSQKFTLYTDLTVSENLTFTARLRKIPPGIFQERLRSLLDFVGFSLPWDTPVGQLPGGLKQDVSLAAALLHDPDIVFLDEPTAGVSPAVRARFWSLIRRLADRGRTVFVTTHHMDEAEECGRVALLRAGRLIALDTPAALKRDTFPEPLVELEWTSPPPAEWRNLLEKAGLSHIVPHGLYYHALVQNPDRWKTFASGRLDLRARPRAPSLEEVFIRRVEEKTP